MPLARTSRRPAQAHRGGGPAPAHRGGTHPLTRTRGPRGRCPSVDPRAPAGPHVRCAPVARVGALTPTRRRPLQSPQYHATPTGGWAGTHQGPPQSGGGGRPGPGDGSGGGGARGASAARRDLTGSARAFLNETTLPAVRALNGAGGPTLLPAMQRIVNAVQPGLISPQAAL